MRHAPKRRHASSSLEGGSVAAHVVGELEGGHHGVLLRHAPQDEVGLASADALLAACTAGFAPGRHSHTSHPPPMPCARAARTVRARPESRWSLRSLMSQRAESVPAGLVALVAPRCVASMVPASATEGRVSLGPTLLA